ncbi:QWRF motif-containing protein 2-like [Quillaja saponaria]|uniref:QWRF motif-containing protein 2-like n=1 Tax=Quillaja saponaria TaxID=32244 RepID=A0AAD7LYI2_QUISA|nr:QWRF motif-containing protein 2-like [Quillaja saponaria]
MVAAVSTALNPKAATQRGHPQNPTRPPLLPSETDNALAPRRPKAREVTSRYMSFSSSTSTSISRRFQSPLVSRNVTSTPSPSVPSLTKRPQSVERRRQATTLPNSMASRIGKSCGSNVPAAQKMLFTSARSLSVSFQGESFSLQVSKAKTTPSPSLRKVTPERRRETTPLRGEIVVADQTENSKSKYQLRRPARMRQANFMNISVDFVEERKRLGGSINMVQAFQNFIADDEVPFDGKKSSDLGKKGIRKSAEVVVERNSAIGSELQSTPIASDTESVSSGTTSGTQDCGGCGGQGQRVSPGIVVPARFWQETNSRLRRQTEPGLPLSKNTGSKILATPKLLVPKKLAVYRMISSPRGVVNIRGQLSPIRGVAHSASPSKLAKPSSPTPLRGLSPSRVSNGLAGALVNNLSNVPSILSFAADLRGGKIGENRIVDAHFLRLLYNRLLQWRFVNAKEDASLSAQKLNAEKSLYNAWVTTSKLSESVRAKRTELQLLWQHFKLISILKEQMIYLEDWALLDHEYSSSLSEATEALRASTLRLPVVGGAKANVLKVKDAICSAVDVMQAMASSICLLLPKVADINSLVLELSNVSAKECLLLHQCNDLLSMIASMQVTECSQKTHILQSKVCPSLTMKV